VPLPEDANETVSDEKVLAKVREMVLPEIERHASGLLCRADDARRAQERRADGGNYGA
jgi:hypothetical protein